MRKMRKMARMKMMWGYFHLPFVRVQAVGTVTSPEQRVHLHDSGQCLKNTQHPALLPNSFRIEYAPMLE